MATYNNILSLYPFHTSRHRLFSLYLSFSHSLTLSRLSLINFKRPLLEKPFFSPKISLTKISRLFPANTELKAVLTSMLIKLFEFGYRGVTKNGCIMPCPSNPPSFSTQSSINPHLLFAPPHRHKVKIYNVLFAVFTDTISSSFPFLCCILLLLFFFLFVISLLSFTSYFFLFFSFLFLTPHSLLHSRHFRNCC